MEEHLPDVRYSVRTSARAKYARLTMSPQQGLTVVVPRHFNPARIPDLVESRLAWIRRTEARMAGDLRRMAALRDAPLLPEEVAFPACGEAWAVSYRDGSGERAGAREQAGGRLAVAAPPGDTAAARDALRRWLTRRARAVLPGQLLQLAGERGFRVTDVSVRAQRSRWASCSAAGAVSLNRSLLFLPPDLARYVYLHELCHLRELSHAPRFWRLLQSEEPASRRLHDELRAGWHHVPLWAQD